jgi:group I intron endonuclease
MYIYKITNTINNRWYIGKTNGRDYNYMGSGKILRQAYAKYGQENFIKEVLESCTTDQELNLREQHWISTTNAITDPTSYNLAEGGSGGDLSMFIPYDKIDYSNYKMDGARIWFNSLSDAEKTEWFKKQASSRSKGWYVSRVDDPTETYVQNISKWCEEHSVDKSMPTRLNDVNNRLFQKQTKGWRIRRSDMAELPPYQNNRNAGRPNNACRGKSWKMIDGKRVWVDKYKEYI